MLIRFLLLLLVFSCAHENSCPIAGKDHLVAASAECQFLLGRDAYSLKDYTGAAARWTQASQTAAKDSRETNFVASATGTLGYFYLNGMGVEQDKTKAINYFQTAIRLGDIESRNHLAFAYSDPRDERYDPISALCLVQDRNALQRSGFRWHWCGTCKPRRHPCQLQFLPTF